jgi:hypothetical protein
MAGQSLPPTTIDAAPDVDGFFRELVSQAIEAGGYATSPASTSYVVSLLAESARPRASALSLLGDGSFTLMLAEALQSHGAHRFEKLRLLGDGVLYVAGFFSDHLTHRGIEPCYLQGLGATAYGGVAAMLRGVGHSTEGPDVFTELSHNFEIFVQVVSAVSEELSLRAVRDDAALLDLYERWLSKSSERLTDLLLSRGLLPTRRTPGLH